MQDFTGVCWVDLNTCSAAPNRPCIHPSIHTWSRFMCSSSGTLLLPPPPRHGRAPPPLQRSGWAHCGCSHTGAQSCTEDRRETLWAALRSRRCGLPFLLSQLQYLGFPAPTWNLWGKGRRLVGSAWHLWWTPRTSSSCLLLCYWVSTQNIWVILLKRISQQCTTSTAAVRGFWSSFGCESLCGSGWSRSGL